MASARMKVTCTVGADSPATVASRAASASCQMNFAAAKAVYTGVETV